jgi:predicted nucleic acid-binding Zn ribbon protein
MKHISSVLHAVLKERQLSEGIRNYSFFARWGEVAGPHLARSTQPLRVHGSTLVVWVENAVLLHHLSYLAPRLLERLQEAAPGNTIDTIRFTLNPEP